LTGRRALQAAVATAAIVPVAAGAVGVWHPNFVGLGTDTYGAYLSGLLLGIGLAFWSLIPRIEQQGRSFSLLTAIVALGGLARLTLALRLSAWGLPVVLPLVMELGVTPLLWLWQRRLARSFLFRSE
jgi:Domain of unknown function (DUF4345)